MADHDQSGHKPPEPQPKHRIFVNDVLLEVEAKTLTGLQIKSLAGRPPAYQLFLEHPGKPDELIADDRVVQIVSEMHFHTVPPAQFG